MLAINNLINKISPQPIIDSTSEFTLERQIIYTGNQVLDCNCKCTVKILGLL